jgi:nitrate/TMAO reductase-like tetraheme cytochrome c subunit
VRQPLWRGPWKLLRDFLIACWEVVKLPFWLIGLGARRLFALGARQLLLLFFAAIVVTIVFSSLMVKVTSEPAFCVTCHFMKPYFDSWRTSSHKNVDCIKCHVPPGIEGTIKHKFMAISMVTDYVTGIYKRSKPWAEIDDASCLQSGCHETRLLISVENFHGVRFDHRPHLEQPRRDRQLRCTSCHAQIVQGQHITVTEGTCFLCHFMPDSTGETTDLGRCTHCHNPPHGISAIGKAFDHGEVLARGVDCLSCHATSISGDGYVPPERCNSCHAEQAHLQRYGDVEFVHQKHVTQHKVDCLQCHIAIRHGLAVERTQHPDKQCASCHGGEQGPVMSVWKGWLPFVPVTPSAMARVGMTCHSCHAEPIHQGQGRFGKPQCTPCHEDKYDALWPTWKVPFERSIQGLEAAAHQLAPVDRERMLNALNIYHQGHPVHDPDLMAELTREIRGSTEPVGGNCASCHPAARELAPVWNGKAVSHQVHAQANIPCQFCHETEEPNHGRLKLTVEECDACHHRSVKAETSCATCHAFQADVYTGKLTIPGGGQASTMSQAGVTCRDCHAPNGVPIERTQASACEACHEASYSDTLRILQHDGNLLLSSIEEKMKSYDPASEMYHDLAELASALGRDRSHTVHNPTLFRVWMSRITKTP